MANKTMHHVVIGSDTFEIVDQYAREHGVTIDSTLTQQGMAADAKAVGDALAAKADSSDVTALDTRVTVVEGDVEDVKEDLSNIADMSLQYKTRFPTASSDGWKLLESGLCARDDNYIMYKYPVASGDIIRIVSDHLFQFQSAASVPSSGMPTRVGETYSTGTFFSKVPENATYLIVSTAKSDSTAGVYSILGNSRFNDINSVIKAQTVYDFGCEVGNIDAGHNDGNQRRCRTSGYISAKSGDKIKCTGEYDYIVWFYDDAKTYLSNTGWLNVDLDVLNDSVAYIRISIKTQNSDTVTSDMVESMAKSVSILRTDIWNDINRIENDYPEAISVSGISRNVGETYEIELGSISATGVNTTTVARCRTKDYIPFAGGKIIPNGLDYAWIMMYDADKKVISQSSAWTNAETNIFINNLAYIRIVFRTWDYANMTLEKANEVASEFTIVKTIPDDVFCDVATLPSYFKSEVERVRRELEAYCTEKALVYAVVTDSHVMMDESNISQAWWNTTIRNIKAVNKAYPFDSLIHLGDMVNGSLPKSDTLALIRSIRDDMIDIVNPNFILVGNHDLNTFYDNMSEPINEDEMYAVWMRYEEKDITKRPGAKPYWYKDYESFGIRVIYLSASMGDGTHGGLAENWGYPQDEITWFINEALNTDKQILLFSHMPMSQGYISGDSTLPHNGNTMKNAVDSFISNGGTVIGLINGHTHWDYTHDNGEFYEISLGAEVNTNNTTNKVGAEIANYVPSTAVMYGRIAGTVTQDLWSVLVVRPESKTCKIIRFGAGEDVTWNY